MNYRNFYALAITAFAMGWILILGGIVLRFSNGKYVNEFPLMGTVACFLGTLATWSGTTFKQQNSRFAEIEAELRGRKINPNL